MKRFVFPTVTLIVVVLTTLLPTASAQQNLSQRLSEQLVQSASKQLNADLYLGQLQVNGLTDELHAEDVRLATRVETLSEPLNQLIIADTIRLQGDWQVLGQQRVTIQQLWLSGAQLTVAYYDTGESNLHTLLAQLKEQVIRYQPTSARQMIDWQLHALVFRDVTINLFDGGQPIASVHVPQLVIDDLHRHGGGDTVNALLFPIIEQLLRQWRAGANANAENIQVDGPALTRFLMREALAF